MSASRRLAAILAADVAGYSRLIGADEEGTLERLRSIRAEVVDPRIAEHHGRLVKTTGDGLLVEFASVVDAVRCATEVQHAMAQRNSEIVESERIEFRIGINIGDVVVEEGDIFGDGVNVAARLEALAESGGICVSGTVRDHIGDRLDLAFDDLGDQNLKNIARPVRVYRVCIAQRPITPSGMPSLAVPDKPSIAVLPFSNMSNDPDQEFFADGIAEDIITALSRYPSIFVIARNSCFTYKGQSVNVKQVGRELGVRYVLEGSLRKSGNRIRVTGQLVEAETGKHVWAERYDRDLADIFAVQDEITQAVTIAIAPAIADAELQRAMRKPPDSLDAWSAYQRGLWHLTRATPEDNALAEKFFRQSISLDPLFSGGYTGLGQVLDRFRQWGSAENQEEQEALARRAVAIDPGDAEARSRLGVVLCLRGQHNEALAQAKHALTASPNLAAAHGALGVVLLFSGQPREGLIHLENCIRLDPFGPAVPTRLGQVALAHYFCREYEAAAEAAKRAIGAYPTYPNSYRCLAEALGQLGMRQEAEEALAKFRSLVPPTWADVYVRGRAAWMRPDDHAHMVEGLRKAGWEGG